MLALHWKRRFVLNFFDACVRITIVLAKWLPYPVLNFTKAFSDESKKIIFCLVFLHLAGLQY